MFGENALEVQVNSDTSGFSGGLDSATKSLGGFKMAVGATGAAVAALGLGAMKTAVDAAREFEEQMVELEKVTNPETAQEMGQAIRDMSEGIPQTQEDLAGIASIAGRLGVEGTENIENFTRVVAEISTATDLAAEDAADSFARIATLTEEPMENIRDLGDVVNGLSNSMGASASEITDAMTRSAGALSQLGVSSEEVAALNATMNEVSSSSRIAGTRLRRFAQELQDPGKVEDLAGALGMSVDEFKQMREESPVDLMREMAQTFNEGGEQADALRSTLSTTSRATISGLAQNLGSLSEAQETANTQMEEGGSLTEEFQAANSTFNAELQRVKNQLRNVAIETGEVLLPVFSDLLSGVSDAIGRFSEFNDQTDGMAGALGTTTAVVGGLGIALAALVGGPVTLAIAGVGALAAAYQTNFGGMRDHVDSAVSEIQAIFDGQLGPALEAAQGLAAKFQRFWANWGDEITAVFSFWVDMVSTVWVQSFDAAITTVTALLQLLNGDVDGALQTMGGYFERTFTRILGFIDEWTGGFATKLVTGIVDAINAAGGALEGFLNDIPGVSGVSIGEVQAPEVLEEFDSKSGQRGGQTQVVREEQVIRFEGSGDAVSEIAAEEANRQYERNSQQTATQAQNYGVYTQ